MGVYVDAEAQRARGLAGAQREDARAQREGQHRHDTRRHVDRVEPAPKGHVVRHSLPCPSSARVSMREHEGA